MHYAHNKNQKNQRMLNYIDCTEYNIPVTTHKNNRNFKTKCHSIWIFSNFYDKFEKYEIETNITNAFSLPLVEDENTDEHKVGPD